jgi:hypothetical protein
MIVCDCRNISDDEPNWEEKVMADNFKCGLCQMRLLMNEDEYEKSIEGIPDSLDALEQFLNKIEEK